VKPQTRFACIPSTDFNLTHAVGQRKLKELLMTMKNRTGCMIIAFLLCGAAPALAQTTPSTTQHVPLQKTIGQAGPDIVPSLIVMNARGASLQGGKLTLTGVAPNSIVFADRPVRAAGHSLTTDLLEEWSPNNTSDESFTKDPPNGTISVFNTDGSKIRDAVVVLKTAKLDGDKLTFDVDVLEGELAGGDGPAALFIDRFGFGGFHAGGFGGFHAGGFRGGYAHVGDVGVARVGAVGVGYHPYVARGAWYRGAPYAYGAAALGGAALGAAAASAAYPYYGATCGYYPYPPCY
jgi:hypothetical protein